MIYFEKFDICVIFFGIIHERTMNISPLIMQIVDLYKKCCILLNNPLIIGNKSQRGHLFFEHSGERK